MDYDPDRFIFYWNGPFSQWQYSEFEMRDVKFTSAEQAMMYFKAALFEDMHTAQLILEASEPGKQKALGRKVAGFRQSKWDEHKEDIVTRVNIVKFQQNKGLRRKLFQTGEKILVEASPMDTIWGIGLDAETAALTHPDDWPGQNLLGIIMMRVRNMLHLEFPDEIVTQDS
jgi:ribA/ribD-fused uncharacterized protein